MNANTPPGWMERARILSVPVPLSGCTSPSRRESEWSALNLSTRTRSKGRTKMIESMLYLWLGFGGAGDAAREPVVEALDVAPVWAAHPVGFGLLTHGGRQFVAFYDAERRA